MGSQFQRTTYDMHFERCKLAEQGWIQVVRPERTWHELNLVSQSRNRKQSRILRITPSAAETGPSQNMPASEC